MLQIISILFDHIFNHSRIFHSFGVQSKDFWPKIWDCDLFCSKKSQKLQSRVSAKRPIPKFLVSADTDTYRYLKVSADTNTTDTTNIGRYRYFGIGIGRTLREGQYLLDLIQIKST